MKNRKPFYNVTVLVVGLGGYKEGSGVSAAKFFATHGANVIINDIKTRSQLKENVASALALKQVVKTLFGRHDEGLVDEADIVFQNPGVPDDSRMIRYAKKLGKPIVNDWTIFFLHPKPNCVGVTGTRGKSTTTTLLYEMCKRADAHTRLAGNIGVSPLTFLSKYSGELVVAELSSWLLRGLSPIKQSPHVSIVTNIMQDHQNMYASMRDYINDKRQIFLHQKPRDYVILNYDDVIVRKMKSTAPGKVVWFGMRIPSRADGVFVKNDEIVARFGGKVQKIIHVDDIAVPGVHNVYNVMVAVAGAKVQGIAKKHIVSAIESFKGIEFRLEYQTTYQDIDIYNDATSTTPDAMIVAIDAFVGERDVVLIAGGADKELDYGAWAQYAVKHTKSICLIPGDATQKMVKALKKYHYRPIVAPTLRSALECAITIAQPGDNIVFSPGAASFNMFRNEFDRGEQFNVLVQNLKQYGKV